MFPLFAGSNPSGYNLTRSLRLRSSASAYLSRTPASATNQKTWTWSGWVKRGRLTTGSIQGLFAGNGSTTSIVTGFRFTATDNLEFISYNGAYTQQVVTTQVFRDSSAWYHVMAVLDTTQATAANRAKIYVNGLQVTAFSTATYPSQNYDAFVNTTNLHVNGAALFGGVIEFFDGYLAEVNFIDGQALTPSSFGSTNALTGVWQPAKYTGTYGTNGFYLPFTDNSALTTSSNVGLGKDFSGNGNYWTTNNISLTAGVTYDSMTDVPTLTSATAANFAVLNPINVNVGGTATVEYANLRMTTAASGVVRYCTIGMSSGKWYAEFIATGGAPRFGVSDATETGADFTGSLTISKGSSTGELNINGTINNTAASFSSTALVSIAYDASTRNVWLAVNGVWQNYSGSGADPATGTNPIGVLAGSNAAYFGVRTYNCSVDCNFGQQPFTYTPPTGFVALNTYNLPTSTIVKGNTVMDATLWTGDGTSPRTITNAAPFQPDLVWFKSRSTTFYNQLSDSVRGATRSIYSNATNAEENNAINGYLSSINSNGFSVINGSTSGGSVNANGTTYVAWQWQAGQGSSSSNTNGSITSTVSVNASAGFSVCTFTNAASGTQTFGHGLGVAPALVLIKGRSAVGSWVMYHQSLGNTAYVFLNSTAASAATGTVWNNTSPTSTVVTMGNITGFWGASVTVVAYCWTPIAGYSAFGSFTGNGSTDGPFIYTGFRPKFIIYKCSSDLGGWLIADTARGTYNLNDPTLTANTSDAEVTGNFIDIVSNGFKFRATSGTGINGSGQTYIYMAFAENPFKNSLAR